MTDEEFKTTMAEIRRNVDLFLHGTDDVKPGAPCFVEANDALWRRLSVAGRAGEAGRIFADEAFDEIDSQHQRRMDDIDDRT